MQDFAVFVEKCRLLTTETEGALGETGEEATFQGGQDFSPQIPNPESLPWLPAEFPSFSGAFPCKAWL